MRIRIVPTFPGKHTVQVVSKRLGKVAIHKHIGTFATEQQKQILLQKAKAYIKFQTGQQELFEPPDYLQLKHVMITQSDSPQAQGLGLHHSMNLSCSGFTPRS